ncbi:MAG: M15 family metallopeptidase [Desulfobulbaceae bacterium]|nr:M15 family metallopeptidase [Desulfobulbaceae bacterium]
MESDISQLDESREMLIIEGESYIIPPPWRGNRFIAPEYDYSDFRLIPVEYTHNGTKIYILSTAHQPLVALLEAAEKDGIFLKVESAYRSEGYQTRIFRRMLAEGRTFDDIVRYVAPPGYSQHILGTAVDFFPSNWRFAGTPAYTWLQENGRRFGFAETYSRFNLMKIPWESWHWNFIGRDDVDQDGSTMTSGDGKK